MVVHFLSPELGFLQIGNAMTAAPLLLALTRGGCCVFFSDEGAVARIHWHGGRVGYRFGSAMAAAWG